MDFGQLLMFESVTWVLGARARTYEYYGRETHSFELDVELVAGLELCGRFVWGLG